MGSAVEEIRRDVGVRSPRFAPKAVVAHYRADGAVVLTSPLPLTDAPANVVDDLERWAAERPDQVFLAERDSQRRWREIGYAAMWARVQAVAQALLDRGLGPEKPIAILSGASIEHAVLTFAGLLAGVPVAPISPSYSLIAGALPRLREVTEVLRPGLVFAQAMARHAKARDVAELADALWLSGTSGDADAIFIGDFYGVQPGPSLVAARQAIGRESIAKILFTSGSTGSPKGVINTHGMLAAAVVQGAIVVPPVEPVIQVDWMPWHHTMAGNAVLHGVLRAGGTLYIDDGRPTPEAFGRTLENIRDVQPTSLQSVPAAFQLLVPELEQDEGFRRAFFQRLTRITYAGASLPQEVWERMQALAISTIGEPVAFGSGYGTTETAPGIAVTHWPSGGHGEIGLPLPGLELKLVPFGDRFEVRVRGPNVTPGYFRRPDLTRAAFDDEGYYKVGDLVEFVDRGDPAQGLRFSGRLSENFKLTCGSWVATGELRLKVLDACRPLVGDLVVTGHDRDDIRLLIWASPSERRRLGEEADGPLGPKAYRILASGIAERLRNYNRANPAKTHKVSAFRLLHEPPSMGAGETTDKGYVNQRGVLARRAALVDELYAPDGVAEVTVLGHHE